MKRLSLLLVVGVILLLPLAPVSEAAARETTALPTDGLALSQEPTAASTSVNWLEPRGLNIVDLVGRVPDEHLKGMILSFTPGYGILTYESGSRAGTSVTIRATVYPRYVEDGGWWGSMFGCLGQPARIDQWGSVAPATTVRLYHGNEDVTSRVDLYSYVPAGRTLPVRNPKESESQNRYRYYERGEWSALSTSFTPDGALRLPANMGCELIMSYTNYEQLTAVFTAEVAPDISVEVVGTETFSFPSYLGPGYAGLLTNLVNQLKARYPERYPERTLTIPAGADYFLLNFPTSPVDMYTQFPANPYDNVDRPTGGTYRIDDALLSVDHVNSMGLPLYGHWRDVGNFGYEYLPHFRTPARVATPEYFVPHGVEYDPCMLSGTCPVSLLDEIWNTRMTMTVVYLRVERTGCGMDAIPLRMVGPGWDASTATATWPAVSTDDTTEVAGGMDISSTDASDHMLYLPLVARYFCGGILLDQPGDQPQGWFTEDGRMLDFVPVQE